MSMRLNVPLDARLKHAVVVVALAFGAMSTKNAYAYVCPPVEAPPIIGSIFTVQAAFRVLFNTLFDQMKQALMGVGRIEVSAIKVMTSQVATAAKAQINANVVLKQGEMAAIGYLETAKLQLKVYQDYSPEFGQGHNPCEQSKVQTDMAMANGQSGAGAVEMVTLLAAAPGRYGSPEGFVNRMFAQRSAKYLSIDEQKLGFGTANAQTVTLVNGLKFPLAGADTNASVLFADATDSRIKDAKQAYLDHVAGAPDVPIAPDVAALPMGKNYLALKGRKDAVMSVAMNSLATIGSENTPNAETGKSKMQAMRDLVDLYYGAGGKAKERWAGWASQSQRGLMVDQLKIDASLLAVKTEQYQQTQRMEAVLGSLLALEAQREYKPALNTSVESINSMRTAPAVR